MSNGRNKGRKGGSGRDAGGFIALPWSVMDSPAYASLSMHARSLLLEIARQYVYDNNGRLLASRAHMLMRGWKSADMLTKAKRELIDGGFIHETVKGHRPNKASWYAVTWQTLDRHPGFDVGAADSFVRSAYRNKAPLKNTSLKPSHGTESRSIGPHHGTATYSSEPSCGSIRRSFKQLPVPSHGHPLDMPSDAIQKSITGT
jgi:hypothetical protein